MSGEIVPEPVTTATLPSRDQLAGADILYVRFLGVTGWKGYSSRNLEGCCVDVAVDESWKLMMIYFESEE
jgi:hypothetical protein